MTADGTMKAAPTAPGFLTEEWAEDVRRALNAGPDEEARAAKLPNYWRWIEGVRSAYSYSWALGVVGLPDGQDSSAYLHVDWQDGQCVKAAVLGPAQPADVAADYVLRGGLASWQRLLSNECDPRRVVMYRELRLEKGDTLAFFQGIYFFAEAIGMLSKVPVRL
jgi:putative sterol carrier protein